jgi:hypothetical protein
MIVEKRLFEVAVLVKTINKASAQQKSIRHGHASRLHLSRVRLEAPR